MIGIGEFNRIRNTKHQVVLDTNILLELYRQPANISLDVIDALKRIADNIFIPRQVYDEYLRNYQKICSVEKKKYQKVKKKLSESVRGLQKDEQTKIDKYRKHNYTDISKLQNELYQKFKDTQEIIDDFENNHASEIQLNIEFLEKDKVKEFVDYLMRQNRIGGEIKFS